MFEILKTILLTLGFAVVIFAVYALLSRYVFAKISVNKWILLAVAIIIFAVSFFIPGTDLGIEISRIILTGIAAIIFFWFLDIQRGGNPVMKKSAKKVVIKPKAKPNRVKNKK